MNRDARIDLRRSTEEQPATDIASTSPTRPFGVHIRMSRWKSLIVLVAAPVILLITQILLNLVVVMVEGPADPRMPQLTPLTIAATGLSTAITAWLLVVLVAGLAQVPWRSVFRRRRPFDWRRVGVYAGGSALLVAMSVALTALIAPESTGWGDFDFGTVTAATIVVIFLLTPLQAAGEEVVFRGAAFPAAGSWFRSVRLAMTFGIVISGLSFAAVHVSLDSWFVSYLMVFSMCTALMGLISGGLEAAIAFHVANNVLVGIVNALFAGNEAVVVDRGIGSGPGAAVLILMVMNVAVVAMVWLVERARSGRIIPEPEGDPAAP